MTTARIALGCLAVAGAAAMLLGSWAPFHLHRAAFEDVWQTFMGSGANLRSERGDLVANVLLSIPFAFSFIGFLQVDRRLSAATVVKILLTLIATGSLSLVCELGQGWLGDRVPSIRDLYAQLIGAAIGCVMWLAFGSKLTPLLNRLLAGDHARTRSRAAITLVAIGVLVWSILPGDVITSPGDLGRKWTSGRIELIPFTRGSLSVGEALYQWIASMCLGLPLGLWIAQFVSLNVKRGLARSEWMLLAVSVGVLPEVLQIPIRGRIASSTDAVFGVIGAAIGIGIGRRLIRGNGSELNVSSIEDSKPLARQPAVWFLAAVCYMFVLCMISWYPFEFVTDSDQIRELIRAFVKDPFVDYRGSNLRILFVFSRLAVLSFALGGVAGIGAGLIRTSFARSLTCLATIGLCLASSVLLELGQLLEVSHSGAGLGLLTRIFASLIGFSVAYIACRGGPSLADAASVGLEESSSLRDAQSVAQTRPSPLATAPAERRSSYVPGMDGLRALACLAVLGVHWHQMTGVEASWGPFDFGRLLENGNTGVAMFMILTGFLLASPLFSRTDQQVQSYSLKGYWTRRVSRILPAYYCALFGLVAITFYWRSFQQLIDVGMHATFLHNLSPKTLYSINAPFWALAPIVQFYALFALVLFVLQKVKRLSTRSLLSSFLCIAVLCQVVVGILTTAGGILGSSELAVAWCGSDAICLQHSLAAHASIFTLGILAAWMSLRLPQTRSIQYDVLIMSCVAICLAVLSTSLDDSLQLRGARYNFPFIPILLGIVVVSVPRSLWFRNVLEWLPIRRLGVISYGFYLFHLPIMKAISRLVGDEWVLANPLFFALVSVIGSAVFSEVSFRVMEQPWEGSFELAPQGSKRDAAEIRSTSRRS